MRILLQIAAMLGLASLSIVGISGCDNSGTSNFEESYVLQGSMNLGQRIGVRLTRTIDIDQYYDEAAVGVSGATVTVWESVGGDTTVYNLIEEMTQLPGTYVASEVDDTVKSGYDYSIRIEADGKVITAATRYAPPPFRIDSCRIVEERPPPQPAVIYPVENFRDSLNPVSLIFGQYFELWYHPVVATQTMAFIVENLEPDWFSNDDLAVSGENGDFGTNFWVWTVQQGDSFKIPPILLSYQGKHRVRAAACDSAAYEYYQVAMPGNPTVDPPTNVQGALGLFAVFAVDTAYFCLTDPEADVVYQCQP